MYIIHYRLYTVGRAIEGRSAEPRDIGMATAVVEILRKNTGLAVDYWMVPV